VRPALGYEPSAASIYGVTPYQQDNSFLIIGERLNASGSKKVRELLNAEDWDGLVAVARLASPFPLNHRRRHRPTTGIRLTFGSWLSMALEFQLGADIVATTVSPSPTHLIQLGVVALIRTFLNVFLGREIEMEQRIEREAAGQAPPPIGR
jgi:uncharacterized membrane protein